MLVHNKLELVNYNTIILKLDSIVFCGTSLLDILVVYVDSQFSFNQ